MQIAEALVSIAQHNDTFVVLDTIRCDEENHKSYVFVNPTEEIAALDSNDVTNAFEQIERLSKENYVVGYMGYELGYALSEIKNSECSPSSFVRAPSYASLRKGRQDDIGMQSNIPLLRFGVYKERIEFDHRDGEWIVPDSIAEKQCVILRSPARPFETASASLRPPQGDTAGRLEGDTLCPRFSLSQKQYTQHIETILNALRRGESYQVNFTGRYTFTSGLHPVDLYLQLRKAQEVSYAALMRFGDMWILSFSPELFFRRQGDQITMKPMKGTAKRGRTLAEDAEQIQWLQTDEKSRAENVMIVDLIRNDLGRICVPGSIKVTDLYAVERYQTVLQMTSTVEGKLRPDCTWFEFFTALFPCGSVTGAPKLRTMEIIHQLEESERGVYCGAIGYLGKGKEGVMNVGIRTVELSKNRNCKSVSSRAQSRDDADYFSLPFGRAQGDTSSELHFYGKMGSGGGIVIDSDPQKEWEEVQLKAKFLTEQRPEFQLIESMRLEDGAYAWFSKHMQRLQDSAEYFQFVFDEEKTRSLCEEYAKQCDTEACKVRLLLSKEGDVALSHQPLDSLQLHGKVLVSDRRTNSQDLFYFHKTTHRPLYKEEYEHAQTKGCDDVLFCNEKGELTEGCISNVVLSMKGKSYTPPVDSGVLPGVYRQCLLEQQDIQERVLYKEDLLQADAVYLCNSVRGMWQARLL